jgi:oxygen-independent coproporphyrinogen-3 oxidase
MGLYVHVPFCKTKCPYCDFNTYQGIENLIGPYLEAVTAELALWGRVLQRPAVNTIFLGGGTPSFLPDGHVAWLLEAARNACLIRNDAEITVEANPDDLDRSKCASLLSQGVNRLSIGVQSLDPGLLVQLGRRHGPGQAIEAFQTARAAGFTNINLDLMYGLPSQTMTQWQSTVQKVTSLRPNHLSLYCLTLEEGTPLHRWVQEGDLPRPDDDLAADMYSYARASLADAGYHHYEVSNWSLPGFGARHNTGYWRNLPYLGVGPGAHSFLGWYRFWQVSSPRLYIARVKEWAGGNPKPFRDMTEEALDTARPIDSWEHIDINTACTETMFMGLRLLDGLDLVEASERAGADLESRYRTQIEELVDLGLLERQDNRLRLTSAAYLIANQVFTRFVDIG